jgi:formamidopyrimidine-DNA glycosylase
VPELPDLEYVASVLQATIAGQPIRRVRVGDPIVLRLAMPGDFAALLTGALVRAVERRGPCLIFRLDPHHDLVVNPMLTGRFRLCPRRERTEASLRFGLEFDGGRELRYLDADRMGKAYLVPRDEWTAIPGLNALGLDILGEGFTLDAFRLRIARRRDQVRAFLLDKTALSAIGNAYADEILFAAGIHPKTSCARLSPDAIEALYASVRRVMAEAIAEVRRRGEPIEEKVRDFLKVRHRKGEPCPRCGTTIRVAGVRGYDSFFCPACQPATRRPFVDWRTLPGPRDRKA